jgi:uncharacterized protein YecE (DUF72 family)
MTAASRRRQVNGAGEKKGRILIGCSGWQYASWRGTFYPKRLATERWLPYYAARFTTVEVNNSFYRLPERRTFVRWADATPREFTFAVKASRYLTHLKRLRDPREPVTRLLQRASGLGRRAGPILYQLPGSFRYDPDRLHGLLVALARRRRAGFLHAVEFRDPSWYRPETFAMLDRRGVALCLHDKQEGAYLSEPVGPFVYVRFHGTSGAYQGSYPARHLRRWAARIAGWAAAGRDVYAYFNNDPGGAAPQNARTLIELTSDLAP